MTVNADTLVVMTGANHNFSEVVRIGDDEEWLLF